MKALLRKLFGGSRRRKSKGISAPGSSATVLGRVKNLARANIEDMLSEATDPQSTANQMMASYEAGLQDARNAVQQAISALRTAEGKQAEDETAMLEWHNRAELAVARAKHLKAKDPSGSDRAEAMALTALKKERALEIRVATRAPQIIQQIDALDELKRGIEKMEARYEELRERSEALVNRAQFAQAQEAIAQAGGRASASDPTSRLDELEDSVRRQEALAQGRREIAESSPEEQFRLLEEELHSSTAESKLNALMAAPRKSLGR